MAALTLPSLVNTTHKIGQKPQNVDAERPIRRAAGVDQALEGGFDHLEIGLGAGPDGHAGDVEAHVG
ncbi:MAG TPA: hypothetical protein VG034_18595, partial [Acidimicrobiia bacterium]|nr:hypothetical protein [Acidimicrobiia bacterium]